MNYIVAIVMPNGELLETMFTWWEFECGYMDKRIASLVHFYYPNSVYSRDKSGVIELIDGKDLVWIKPSVPV